MSPYRSKAHFMAAADDSALIDRIYECSVFPDLWPGVLDSLAALAGARGGLLFAFSPAPNFVWTASPSVREVMGRFFSDLPRARTSQRVERLLGAGHAGFLREHDVYSDEDLARDTVYRDFLWPAGLGHATGTALDLPTGNRLVLSLERERALGPVEDAAVARLDALRPHIARAAFLSTRLSLARARAAADALAATGLPALVFGHNGRVLAANDLVEPLRDQVAWLPGDRFGLVDRAANALLQQALATPGIGPVRSFVTRQAGRPKMVAHLIPLTGTARDFVASCAAILVLTPVAMGRAAPVELIQSLFDLTPAEARVARGLAAGDSVADIADARAVSLDTVRSQVRAVLEKTGCRRQTEVAVMLGGLGPGR